MKRKQVSKSSRFSRNWTKIKRWWVLTWWVLWWIFKAGWTHKNYSILEELSAQQLKIWFLRKPEYSWNDLYSPYSPQVTVCDVLSQSTFCFSSFEFMDSFACVLIVCHVSSLTTTSSTSHDKKLQPSKRCYIPSDLPPTTCSLFPNNKFRAIKFSHRLENLNFDSMCVSADFLSHSYMHRPC